MDAAGARDQRDQHASRSSVPLAVFVKLEVIKAPATGNILNMTAQHALELAGQTDKKVSSVQLSRESCPPPGISTTTHQLLYLQKPF